MGSSDMPIPLYSLQAFGIGIEQPFSVEGPTHTATLRLLLLDLRQISQQRESDQLRSVSFQFDYSCRTGLIRCGGRRRRTSRPRRTTILRPDGWLTQQTGCLPSRHLFLLHRQVVEAVEGIEEVLKHRAFAGFDDRLRWHSRQQGNPVPLQVGLIDQNGYFVPALVL